jgi:hypothetical protein
MGRGRTDRATDTMSQQIEHFFLHYKHLKAGK